MQTLAVPAPAAAACIAAEMLLFCALHAVSDSEERGPVAYWLVVAVISGFLAYGRFVLEPF